MSDDTTITLRSAVDTIPVACTAPDCEIERMTAYINPPLPEGADLDEIEMPPCPECGEVLDLAQTVEVAHIDWTGGKEG